MHTENLTLKNFRCFGSKPEIVILQPDLTAVVRPIRERRVVLSVYLDDPDVAIDNNHLDRVLRAISMGKKNWLFCWTELGAKHVGILQSLITICRMHGINPYDYFVDVLQHISQHPALLVHQHTPPLWKQMLAGAPLRSDLNDVNLRGNIGRE
ncbi:MAG: transposase [Pseudomonadota bacterium]